MTNETMLKFGYPGSLIREYEHWAVMLRPAQVTLGSLVLAARSDATAFGQLPPGAHTPNSSRSPGTSRPRCATILPMRGSTISC